jgi:hypothetical protein
MEIQKQLKSGVTPRRLKPPWLFILVLIAAALSSLYFKYFSAPFIWGAATWSFVMIFGVISSSKSLVKAIFLNIGVVIIVLGCYEAYLYKATENNNISIEYISKEGHSKSFNETHELFGYAPVKNSKVTARSFSTDKVIFEVTYTINSQGLRIGPHTNNYENDRCVLFFGDSITFGHGVNDNEAMPYLVRVKSAGRYTTYNLGFLGYGPHQTLAALEHGIIANLINCEPNYAILQTITDHVERSSGKAHWDTHGPRYILDENGQVVFTGHFNDYKGINSKLTSLLQRSAIISKIPSKYSEEEINLFIAIIAKSRELFERNYQDAEFHVIFWDNEWHNVRGELDRVLQGLQAREIRVHLISNILPDYNVNSAKYLIDSDWHPNALAHRLIADYVVKNILKK